jgi:hypothetical protein
MRKTEIVLSFCVTLMYGVFFFFSLQEFIESCLYVRTDKGDADRIGGNTIKPTTDNDNICKDDKLGCIGNGTHSDNAGEKIGRNICEKV